VGSARYVGWARALLARLARHPRLVVSLLGLVRRLPGRRLVVAGQRHFSRPLLRRMAAKLEVPVAGGFRMRVETDGIGRVLAVEGIWEPHVTALFRSLLAPGDVCVDVGANIGYFTLLAARLVGPEGHVYALEPAPATFAALVSSVELNGFSNITTLCVAAGEAPGEAVLEDRDQSVLSAIRVEGKQATEGARTLTVPVQPVASVIRPCDLPRLRLVKVDVEGYELEVLRGLQAVFEHGSRPSVLVELHAGRGEAAVPLVLELIHSYGLKAERVFAAGTEFRLEPWVDHDVGRGGRHILLTP
jgi:FkbM family methyltransferase